MSCHEPANVGPWPQQLLVKWGIVAVVRAVTCRQRSMRAKCRVSALMCSPDVPQLGQAVALVDGVRLRT